MTAIRGAVPILALAALALAAAPARAQVDAHCSARSVPQNAPGVEPFLLFFDWNSVAFDRQAVAILDNIVNVLATIPACPVYVGGHADRSGPAGYNMELSRRRAEAIRTYLPRHGVHAKIELRGFGETRPLVDTPDGVREPQNRWGRNRDWVESIVPRQPAAVGTIATGREIPLASAVKSALLPCRRRSCPR